jgi:hypothetical protein
MPDGCLCPRWAWRRRWWNARWRRRTLDGRRRIDKSFALDEPTLNAELFPPEQQCETKYFST